MRTLERMVADRYVLVCLSGAAARGQIPSFGWMKRCYQAMDWQGVCRAGVAVSVPGSQ